MTADGRQGSGGDPQTTNQRMELQAVLEALRAIDDPVVVHSDSTYVVNCFNDRWYEGWLKRGWRNSQKKPVANRDIWEPLIDLYLDRSDEIEFVWVKGHAGNALNEIADALAVEQAQAFRQAETPAVASANADVLDPEPPWPVERAIGVFGPGKLDDDLSEALEEAVAGLDPANDILVSGLRRGSELRAAEAAMAMQVPVAAVLPYADPASGWPAADLERFERALTAAQWVVDLELQEPKPSKALARRDRWIEQASIGAIVVGDDALADRLEGLGLGVILVVPDE